MGPGGRHQWRPTAASPLAKQGKGIPFAMLTTDIALKTDEVYLDLSTTFAADLATLNNSFAHAWYKLSARDMGPATRCVGRNVPPAQPFQYPLPPPPLIPVDFQAVKAAIATMLAHESPLLLAPNRDVINGKPSYAAMLVHLAWQCASSFRATDYKGGCNGAHIRFSPAIDWPINAGIAATLELLRPIKTQFGDLLSWSDLIVLSGTVGLELLGSGSLDFCGNRTDAVDGNGWNVLLPNGNYSAYPWSQTNYSDNIFYFRNAMNILGLSNKETVALAARPRSQRQLRHIGYTAATWMVGESTGLSNEYFQV